MSFLSIKWKNTWLDVVQSLLAQTLNNIEILLVDDGSPDRCGEICDGYDREYPDKIRVHHKENGGLSDAHNAGLKMAAGEYITFVDSDDWVASNLLAVLHNHLVRYQADISACRITLVYPDRQIPAYWHADQTKVLGREDAILQMAEGTFFASQACGKLYRRSLFENVAFPVKKQYEDLFTTYRVFDRAQKVVLTPDAEYFYLQRGDSIANRAFNHAQMDWLEGLHQMLRFCEKPCPSARDVVQAALVFANLDLLNHALRAESSPASDLAFLRKNKRKDELHLGFYSRVAKIADFRHRAAVLLLLVCPKLYSYLINR